MAKFASPGFIVFLLWLNFILGLNFIFLCFRLILIYYHTEKQRKIKFEPRITYMYPASRVFFDLPRLVGKRKKTLPTASRIHIEHAPKSNVTKPCSASLSSCNEMTGKKIHCIITSLKLIYRLLPAQNLYLVGDEGINWRDIDEHCFSWELVFH